MEKPLVFSVKPSSKDKIKMQIYQSIDECMKLHVICAQ